MFTLADIVMCCFWVIAYALALLCTLKEKKVVIPPLASAIILPWEIIAAFSATEFSYSTFGKLGWSCIHFSIFVLNLFFLKVYSKKVRFFYVFLFAAVIGLLSYVFTLRDGMFYTSFIHTIMMMVIITIYAAKRKGYPLTVTNFYFAFTALLGDFACCLRYNHFLFNSIIEILALFLFSINITHVSILYIRLKKNNITVFQNIKKDFLCIESDFLYLYNKNVFPFLNKYIFPFLNKYIFPFLNKYILPFLNKYIFPFFKKRIFPFLNKHIFPQQTVQKPKRKYKKKIKQKKTHRKH